MSRQSTSPAKYYPGFHCAVRGWWWTGP